MLSIEVEENQPYNAEMEPRNIAAFAATQAPLKYATALQNPYSSKHSEISYPYFVLRSVVLETKLAITKISYYKALQSRSNATLNTKKSQPKEFSTTRDFKYYNSLKQSDC
jgi:hypothetical protein